LAPANLTRLASFGSSYPRAADAIALAGGVLLCLAFAPVGWFPLAFVCPALLFVLWHGATPARAAWRGFLFGLGLFGLGASWVYVSLHNFGNMAAPLAGLATFFFVAILAVSPALAGWAQARLARGHEDDPGLVHYFLVLPALWVLQEWLRGAFLSGFPWLHLGYSQIDTLLAGFAPWLGVYGVSLVTAMVAAALSAALLRPARVWRAAAILIVAVTLLGYALGRVEWSVPADGALRVALVQGNVPLRIKWAARYRDEIVARYLARSRTALDADLVVWPEAAVPAYLDETGGLRAELRMLAGSSQTAFLTGIVERERGRHYNSVLLVSRDGEATYRKRHLVPFGEYLPLKPWLQWLLDYLQIPMSDFTPGPPVQAALAVKGQKLGISVCYEDAFGEEVIRTLPTASVLVNVSEDAWFGDSLAPHQRLQMARMRALETARPMVRSANTGPSAVIDHRGVVLARSQQFEELVLRAEVVPRAGVTPYVRVGNLLVVILALFLVVAGWGWRRTRP
jgi:apolipoprotein N-acyltransferase